MRETLLVTKLHAGQIEHAVLHGAFDTLSLARCFPMIKSCDDTEGEMQPGAGIADLGARDQRWPIEKTGCRGRPAGTLRDIFIDLAILIGTRAEPFYRGVNHARVDFLDFFPRKPHPVDGAGCEIFHHHIAFLDKPGEYLFAGLGLGVERHAALVVVQHGEIKAVHIRNVT